MENDSDISEEDLIERYDNQKYNIIIELLPDNSIMIAYNNLIKLYHSSKINNDLSFFSVISVHKNEIIDSLFLNDKFLITCSDIDIIIWEYKSQEKISIIMNISKLKENFIHLIESEINKNTFYTFSINKIICWDLLNGQCINTFMLKYNFINKNIKPFIILEKYKDYFFFINENLKINRINDENDNIEFNVENGILQVKNYYIGKMSDPHYFYIIYLTKNYDNQSLIFHIYILKYDFSIHEKKKIEYKNYFQALDKFSNFNIYYDILSIDVKSMKICFLFKNCNDMLIELGIFDGKQSLNIISINKYNYDDDVWKIKILDNKNILICKNDINKIIDTENINQENILKMF